MQLDQFRVPWMGVKEIDRHTGTVISMTLHLDVCSGIIDLYMLAILGFGEHLMSADQLESTILHIPLLSITDLNWSDLHFDRADNGPQTEE